VHEELWAITAYFNPGRYSRRLENYREFRKRLRRDVPLVAVECADNDAFQLCARDADILVQVRGDTMWQKERLLDLAMQRIPRSASAVAWLDCDIVFEDNGWPEKTLLGLRECPVLQLFEGVAWLEKAVDLNQSSFRPSSAEWQSLALENSDGILTDSVCAAWRRQGSATPFGDGYAWAGRYDLIAAHGLYDANVIGGGARTFALAAMNRIDSLLAIDWFTEKQRLHIERWARPFAAKVTDVGHISGRIFHLWHGSIKNRQYLWREERFRSFEFDPYGDIALNDDGCWVWASEKPDMHSWVKNYLHERREDG